MKRVLVPLVVLACATAASCSEPAPAKTGALFNGKDFAGWEFVSDPKADVADSFTWKDGGVLAVAGKPIGWIATVASHENFRLHVEWRWSDKAGNAGVLVNIATGPKDRIWPQCFQIQTKGTRAGDVLPMAGATCAELASPTAKQVDRQKDSSEKPVGEWNACDIVCRGDTIECTINGVLQNRITHCVPRAGRIGFQLEGVPYELRNVRLEALDK
jgi:hypothetical protein